MIAAASRVVEAADILRHRWPPGGEGAGARSPAPASQFIEQAEQRGTGHAIQCALPAMPDYENILVLSGDVPLIRPETSSSCWRFHQTQGAAMTILTADARRPHRLWAGPAAQPALGPEVDAIVEQKALKPEQGSIHEINSGIYAFKTSAAAERIWRN